MTIKKVMTSNDKNSYNAYGRLVCMKENPFTLTFGKVPSHFISRPVEFGEIISNFIQDPPSIQTYLITGVRGSGKTALLAHVCSSLEEKNDWIVVDINPEKDILTSLASKLYEKGKAKHLFLKMNLSLSFQGISLSISGGNPIIDSETILEKLLGEMKKAKRKVLIAIDEVSNSEHMRIFAHTFQTLLRQDMPVFLLMTGLYENVKALQNQKSLTFLYRAPAIDLKPLDLESIAVSYQSVLSVDRVASVSFAKLTCGYAFAYQTLGFLLYQEEKTVVDEELLTEFDEYLRKCVYDKIWEDTPLGERKILMAISSRGSKTKEILERADCAREDYASYRDRLMKKGILESPAYGYIRFALPRFYEFILKKRDFA